MRRTIVRAAILAGSLVVDASGADEVTLHAEVDARKVGVEDRVQLTVSLGGRSLDGVGEVRPPALANLRVAGGPFLSTQVSFVNGAVSQAKSYTWVLEPLGVGPAEVGAVRVAVGNAERATAPIAIEVVAGSVAPQAAPRRRSPLDPFGDEDPVESVFGPRRRRPEPKLLVEAVASRDRLHVGEAVLVSYVLYTQTGVTDVQLADAPQYPGFWAEDPEAPRARERGERTTRDGEAFVRYTVLRKMLFPTKPGRLAIPPATFRLGLPRMGLFDAGPEAVTRTTEPLTITVDPIPTEPGFSGAVGSFEASARLERAAVALGEAATLRFVVEGTGNLKWIDQGPEVRVEGAKVYPPQVKTDVTVGPGGMRGSRAWEFVVVPETSGTLSVPPLRFSYYDPAAGALRRVETPALPLTVTPGEGGATAVGPATAPTSRSAGGGLALRSDLEWPSGSSVGIRPRAVAVGLALALLIHGALWAGPRLADRRLERAGRPAGRRGRRQALAEIERVARGGLTKEAAALAIERALQEAFGASADGAGGSEGGRRARELLDEVQFIRYAPQLGDYSETLRDVAARAAEVVRRWA